MYFRMKRQKTDSSLAKSIGYNPESNVLELEFRGNGKVWQYFLVPPSVYLELLASDSIGRYFNDHIKGHYPEKEVE